MREQVKELRLAIDGLAQLTKELKPINKLDIEDTIFNILNETLGIEKSYQNSKEIEKAVDSLYLAKFWLSKLLKELHNEFTEDVIVNIQGWEGNQNTGQNKLTHSEKIEWLITETHEIARKLSKGLGRIQGLNTSLKELAKEDECNHTEKQACYNIWNCINQSYNHASEAKFWLESELERIKNEK